MPMLCIPCLQDNVHPEVPQSWPRSSELLPITSRPASQPSVPAILIGATGGASLSPDIRPLQTPRAASDLYTSAGFTASGPLPMRTPSAPVLAPLPFSGGSGGSDSSALLPLQQRFASGSSDSVGALPPPVGPHGGLRSSSVNLGVLPRAGNSDVLARFSSRSSGHSYSPGQLLYPSSLRAPSSVHSTTHSRLSSTHIDDAELSDRYV